MPIEITSDELTANHKKAVRKEFKIILKSLDSKQPESYAHMLAMIEKLGSGRNKFKKILTNYLMAIYKYLDLPERRWAHRLDSVFLDKKYEKQLLACLIYFMDPDDVIPDHIAYIGRYDDAYCVNLSLSKQKAEVIRAIEQMVVDLGALER
jgi:uncharacterized membrane protein YkvA (DUF1232 family)